MRMAPVPPSGWPRAMAPPLGLTVSGSGLSSSLPREHHRGEGLVDLGDVDVGHRQAGAGEQVLGGVDRAGEHEHRVAADEARCRRCGPAGAARGRRPSPASSGARRRRRRRSATRCRRCGGRPRRRRPGRRGHDGLQAGEPLERGVAQALVAADVVGRAGGLAVVVEVGRVDRRRSGRRSGPPPTPGRRRSWERWPNASSSSRVMPHFSAISSAPWNWEVHS